MGQLQNAIDHAGSTSKTKCPTGCFYAGKTIHEFAETGAVELREPGEIEDHANLTIAEQLIEGQFELLALDANLERTGEFEDEDAGLEFFFDDFQWHLSIRGDQVRAQFSGPVVSGPS